MKIFGIVLVVMVASILCLSCGGGGGEMVKAQEGFADKACACKTIDCIKGVQQEQVTWVTEHGQAGIGNEEAAAKIEAANTRLSECIQKIVQDAAKAASGQ